MKKKSVLLLGASGLVGGACLNLLLNDEFYEEIILPVRRPLDQPPRDPRVRQYVVDFDRIDEFEDVFSAQDVFCTIGTTMKKAGSKENFYKVDFTTCHEAARIALRNGAQQIFLVSASGANEKSLIYYTRVKGLLETSIKRLPFESIHILRPSLILGDRKEFRLGEEFAKSVGERMAFAIPGKYKPIHAKKIAAAMVSLAKNKTAGIHVYESDMIAQLVDNPGEKSGS